MKNKQSGFTLVELVLVMGILLIFFGFLGFNLISQQRTTSINAISDILISDMASQQTKAMVGAGLTNGVSHGIYFQQDSYVLFQGTTYSQSDPGNFIIPLDPGFIFTSIPFSNSSIVFSSRSGEVNEFLEGNNTLTIQDSQGIQTKNITINRYGVVTGDN